MRLRPRREVEVAPEVQIGFASDHTIGGDEDKAPPPTSLWGIRLAAHPGRSSNCTLSHTSTPSTAQMTLSIQPLNVGRVSSACCDQCFSPLLSADGNSDFTTQPVVCNTGVKLTGHEKFLPALQQATCDLTSPLIVSYLQKERLSCFWALSRFLGLGSSLKPGHSITCHRVVLSRPRRKVLPCGALHFRRCIPFRTL